MGEQAFTEVHLMRSLQSIPHINIAREICAEHLVEFKEQNKSLTYTDIILKVFGQSLTGFPVFKTAIMDEKVFTAESINIGLVVDAGETIRIPVLRGVDQKEPSSNQLRKQRADEKSAGKPSNSR